MSNGLKGTIVNPEAIYGKSAYEIAVIKGFEGTEEEWLESLKGERGEAAFIEFTDDNNGNVTLTAHNGTINLVNDGEGNVSLEVI